jgi:K(+)-stimulated pyrophosphate-energized sodium pump
VALNPVIKFTTLFGLLAVELADNLSRTNATLTHVLAAVFFLASFAFVYRSFYGMRIHVDQPPASSHHEPELEVKAAGAGR